MVIRLSVLCDFYLADRVAIGVEAVNQHLALFAFNAAKDHSQSESAITEVELTALRMFPPNSETIPAK